MKRLAVLGLLVLAAAARADAVDRLREFVRDVKSGRASFTQTVTAVDGVRKKTSSGSFEFARPDRFRFARGGAVRERTLGDKDLMIVYDLATGGTVERETDERARASLCLDDAMLAMLEALTARAEAVFGGTQDLEFAFEGRTLHLLQRRAITRFAS